MSSRSTGAGDEHGSGRVPSAERRSPDRPDGLDARQQRDASNSSTQMGYRLATNISLREHRGRGNQLGKPRTRFKPFSISESSEIGIRPILFLSRLLCTGPTDSHFAKLFISRPVTAGGWAMGTLRGPGLVVMGTSSTSGQRSLTGLILITRAGRGFGNPAGSTTQISPRF